MEAELCRCLTSVLKTVQGGGFIVRLFSSLWARTKSKSRGEMTMRLLFHKSLLYAFLVGAVVPLASLKCQCQGIRQQTWWGNAADGDERPLSRVKILRVNIIGMPESTPLKNGYYGIYRSSYRYDASEGGAGMAGGGKTKRYKGADVLEHFLRILAKGAAFIIGSMFVSVAVLCLGGGMSATWMADYRASRLLLPLAALLWGIGGVFFYIVISTIV